MALLLASLCVSAFAAGVSEVKKVFIEYIDWPTEGNSITPNDTLKILDSSTYASQLSDFIRISYEYVDAESGNTVTGSGLYEYNTYWMSCKSSTAIDVAAQHDAHTLSTLPWQRVYDDGVTDPADIRYENFKRIVQISDSTYEYYTYKIRIEITAPKAILFDAISADLEHNVILSLGAKDDTTLTNANKDLVVELMDYDAVNGKVKLDIYFKSLLSSAYAENCKSCDAEDGEIKNVDTSKADITYLGATTPLPATGRGPATYEIKSKTNPFDKIQLTITRRDEPVVTTEDISISLSCGYTPQARSLTITNTSTTESTTIKNVEMSGGTGLYFDIIFPGEITLAPGESTTEVKIVPKPSLGGGRTYKEKFEVTYTIPSILNPTKKTDAWATLVISHVYDARQGGWCTKCDAYRADFTPRIVSGDRRTYYINFWPAFKINTMFSKLYSVKVDGNALAWGSQFTAELEDYTKVVLQNSYIRTLQPGKHTIEFVFKDSLENIHSVSGYFRLSSATGVYTGDENNLYRESILMLGSVTGIWLIIFSSLNKRFKKQKKK